MADDLPVPYAAARLAELIARGSVARDDPKTLVVWARNTGRSRGSLRGCCRAAHTRPRAALDVTRLLRALRLRSARPDWTLSDLLDISDERSLVHLLQRGGLTAAAVADLTIEDFIRSQRYLPKGPLVVELARLVSRG